MTPAEALTVLAAAKESARSHQWDDVVHQLRAVHDQALLTGTDQGDAAYLLGRAYLNTGSKDGAHYYFDEAAGTAGHEFRAAAQAGLAEITRYDKAVDDEVDGVSRAETAEVLRAGDDALARADLADAMTHYRAAYDGLGDDEPRARAALGIATVLAHQGDLDQAAQYAEYVVGTGAKAKDDAQHLLTWIHDQRAAGTAASDGTTADEYAATFDAGRAAYDSHDYARALTLFASIYEAPQLGTLEHARAAFNLAQCHRLTGDPDGARPYYEFVAAHGTADMVGRAHHMLEVLDRRDHADELADELERSLTS